DARRRRQRVQHQSWRVRRGARVGKGSTPSPTVGLQPPDGVAADPARPARAPDEMAVDSPVPKAVGIIGVPLAYGASMAGVELGPAALRVARLNRRISQLGYKVRDLGDLHVPEDPGRAYPADKLKHLGPIPTACEDLATQVEQVLDAGELPLILGGDHSIAIGSV